MDTHDFPDDKLGKAIRYGIYDLASKDTWVSVGIDHDTGEFAVASIAEWWKWMACNRYVGASRWTGAADPAGLKWLIGGRPVSVIVGMNHGSVMRVGPFVLVVGIDDLMNTLRTLPPLHKGRSVPSLPNA